MLFTALETRHAFVETGASFVETGHAFRACICRDKACLVSTRTPHVNAYILIFTDITCHKTGISQSVLYNSLHQKDISPPKILIS
jgi:hypothetical protein